MVGRTLAHYLILEQIGAGGMGVVYRARDTQLGRSVALKVVGERTQVDEAARARLLREARTASALNHPNICTIHEAGVADGETYIAMELVEGQTLSAMVSGDGLPAEIAIRYGVQIADALAHAHERGVVHRDLKSPNVIITPEGRPKVLDFGLATRVFEGSDDVTRSLENLNDAAVVVGTLPYMAPEILRGEPADARSDLWALGVMLYHALSGTLPFRGATAFEISSAIARDSPAPLPGHMPAGLTAIIGRLLAKQPGERYQRASELRAALEAVQPGVVVAGPEPVAWVSRQRWLWAAGSIVFAAALVWVSAQWRSKPPMPAKERRLSEGSRPSANREANEYFERSLLFGGMAVDNSSQRRRMVERALELDPKFAAARAEFAFSQVVMLLQGESNDPSLFYRTEEQVRQALQDDPGCSRAHAVLALNYLLQGRKELVPGQVDRALKANPDEIQAPSWLVQYHRLNGDYAQAQQLARQSIVRWPLFWPGHLNLGELFREQGDTAGAIREQERVLEQDPYNVAALSSLARAYIDSDDLRNARQTLERARPDDRQNYVLRQLWALLMAREGKRAEALQEMDAGVQAYAGISIYGPLQATEFYAVMGDTGKALEWLDRAVRMGDDREGWLRRDPLLASLRRHPRFEQMLASVAYRRQQRHLASPATESR